MSYNYTDYNWLNILSSFYSRVAKYNILMFEETIHYF